MERRHDIDTLRVAAFATLILYHVGMVYVDGWGFHVKSQYLLGWVEWPMVLVNRWRMALLFLLSGIALGLVLPRRTPLQWVRDRSWRLLVPLAAGIAFVVPIQAYCEARMLGTIEPGFLSFLARYLQLRPWPEAGFAGAAYGFTWNHLWYLPYLWTYTLLAVGGWTLLRHTRATRWPDRLCTRGRWLLWTLPPLWMMATLVWLDPRYPSTHALADDWANHAEYLPVFVIGLLVARKDAFWDALVRLRWRLAWLALGGATVYMGLRVAGRVLPPGVSTGLSPETWWLVSRAAHALYWWTALMALLAWGKVLLARPRRWLPYAREAVFPWYVLHQSLTVAAAYGLAAWRLGPVVEPLLVLGITLGGCAVLHEFVVRRTPWLRPLFGLPGVRRNMPPAVATIATCRDG